MEEDFQELGGAGEELHLGLDMGKDVGGLLRPAVLPGLQGLSGGLLGDWMNGFL